jgi:hypothetical protein
VLQLLGYRLPTLLLAGQHSLTPEWPLLQPFHKMPLQARHAVLQRWAHSSLPPLRKVGHTHSKLSDAAVQLRNTAPTHCSVALPLHVAAGGLASSVAAITAGKCVSHILAKHLRVLRHPSAAAAVPCWQAYKALKSLVSAAVLTHIDPATGSNPCFDALGYIQGDRLQERGLGPLPAAAEAAEEVLCSATVHVPQLVADGMDVQVGSARQLLRSMPCVVCAGTRSNGMGSKPLDAQVSSWPRLHCKGSPHHSEVRC